MIGANLWEKYRETRDEGLQNQLIEQCLPLVRLHAARIAPGLPRHICRDDLIQAGVLGLMEAVKRYDPGRGVKFETFAGLRIRGAMVDELRRLSWLPRSLFREMREIDRAAQAAASRLGREPEDDELAAELGMPLEKLQKVMGEINCAALVSLEDSLFAVPAVDGPDVAIMERLIAQEEKERLAAAIEALPERYRQLLAHYYQEGLTLKETGLVLGVTESRVCQLHARIIARLRTALET